MNNQNLLIETERLIIRPFTLEDIEASYNMNLDPEVSKYTGDGGVVSKNEIEKRITQNILGDYQKYGFGRLAVDLKKENKFIGFTGLKYLDDIKEVDLGYRFIRSYWGNGYATESGMASISFGFESLGINKIIAMVLPENINSIRVLEKLNFKYQEDILEYNQVVKLYTLTKS